VNEAGPKIAQLSFRNASFRNQACHAVRDRFPHVSLNVSLRHYRKLWRVRRHLPVEAPAFPPQRTL